MKNKDAAYILEKTVGAIRDLAHLAKKLTDNELEEAELRESVDLVIYQSLYDLTKVASTASGTTWEVGDRDIILNDPEHGLEQLEKRYGCISETSKERRDREFEEFVGEIVALLNDSERAPARTILNDLLVRSDVKGSVFEALLTELEGVHQGKTSWDVFRKKALCLLESASAE